MNKTPYTTSMNLSHLNLSNVDFTDCNLTLANFSHAYFNKTNFSRANLEKANLKTARNNDSIFSYTNLCGARIMPEFIETIRDGGNSVLITKNRRIIELARNRNIITDFSELFAKFLASPNNPLFKTVAITLLATPIPAYDPEKDIILLLEIPDNKRLNFKSILSHNYSSIDINSINIQKKAREHKNLRASFAYLPKDFFIRITSYDDSYKENINLNDYLLETVCLSNIKVHRSSFNRMQLKFSYIVNSIFESCNFYEANLHFSSLYSVTFKSCSLINVIFSQTILSSVDFTHSTLIGADFRYAINIQSTFDYANLHNARFTPSFVKTIDNCVLITENKEIIKAAYGRNIITSLEELKIKRKTNPALEKLLDYYIHASNAESIQATFEEFITQHRDKFRASQLLISEYLRVPRKLIKFLPPKTLSNLTLDLSYLNLSYADLSGLSLRGANLRGTRLNSSILSFTDLSGACLVEAKLINALLNHTNLSYCELNLTDFAYSLLIKVDFTHANLSGANLYDQVTNIDSIFKYTNLHHARVSVDFIKTITDGQNCVLITTDREIIETARGRNIITTEEELKREAQTEPALQKLVDSYHTSSSPVPAKNTFFTHSSRIPTVSLNQVEPPMTIIDLSSDSPTLTTRPFPA